jgi:regulator of sigma E protease
VEPDTPAARAGLKEGDRIVAVNGETVRNFEDFSGYVKLNARSPIDIQVERDGKSLNLKAIPELTDQGCVGRLGVLGSTQAEGSQVVRADLIQAAGEGVWRTWRIIEQPFQFLGQVFRGNACASSLGGPIKIAEVSKTFASQGFINLIPLIAFISISVGLFNLFPIPVLDGGHLLFYGAEAILGRPLSQRSQEIGFQFGFILLLMLMVFVTWNNLVDLGRDRDQASLTKKESTCNR